MANWLQKVLLPSSGAAPNRSLPVKSSASLPTAPDPKRPESLPNASLIYGMASSALFVVAVYFLLTGVWFTGFLVLLPAGCFLGFALYFLRAR